MLTEKLLVFQLEKVPSLYFLSIKYFASRCIKMPPSPNKTHVKLGNLVIKVIIPFIILNYIYNVIITNIN